MVAFDQSPQFIAREPTKADAIDYHVAGAADAEARLSHAPQRFDKAVCTMAVMDMPEIIRCSRCCPGW